MRLRAVLMLVVCCGGAVAQGDTYLATVSGDKVRLRGGPADFHAVLEELSRGTPVRVVAAEGDWKRVEVPGGFEQTDERAMGETVLRFLVAPGR